jgi:hypothetical protein
MLPLLPRSPNANNDAAANAYLLHLCIKDCIRRVEAIVEASVEAKNASTTAMT